MQSRGCVAGGINVVQRGCDAAGAVGGATVRCRSPGGSSTEPLRPTTLCIPTTLRATSLATCVRVIPTCTPRPALTAAQKDDTSALYARAVKNTRDLVRYYQLGKVRYRRGCNAARDRFIRTLNRR